MKREGPADGGLDFGRLIRRSLAFHWRSHLGVVLGAMVGSAALIGALVVGDSVRGSLRQQAHDRLGATEAALDAGDRLVTEGLAGPWSFAGGRSRARNGGSQFVWGSFGGSPWIASALQVRGTVSRQDGTARAHDVKIYGATSNFWAFSLAGTDTSRAAFSTFGPVLSPERRQAVLDALASWQRPAAGRVRLGEPLARQLNAKPGDALVVRFPKPSALSQDAVLNPRNESDIGLRLVVEDVVGADEFGNFSLMAGQRPPMNAFVNLEELWGASGLTNRYNLVLARAGYWSRMEAGWRERVAAWLAQNSGWLPAGLVRTTIRFLTQTSTSPALAEATLDHLETRLERQWQLADGQIEVRLVEAPSEASAAAVEIVTPRIFLSEPVVTAATRPDPRLPEFDRAERGWMTNGAVILTYLANSLQSGDRLTPYSMVTAAGPPWTPADLAEDEIVVNEWLAEDLGVKAGDTLAMTYFDPEAGARLVEKTNEFRVRSVVPLRGVHGDRTLMPEFPGLAKAESTRDWDAGFPLAHRIREKDEAYWKAYRGTPKAFVSLEAGRRMWANRFGAATAIRHMVPAGMVPGAFQQSVAANLRANLRPEDIGLAFQPVRQRAVKAATSGQDFGGLFIGFSLFLVVSALILMALLFQFGLEQRLPEVGTLLAVGFNPQRIRRLWLGEGMALALVGGVLGVVGGAFYARAMIRGLGTIWREAVAGAALEFHLSATSVLLGLAASLVVCGLTLWLALRKQFARPARELLAGEIRISRGRRRGRGTWVGLLAMAGGLSLAGWALAVGDTSNAGVFFGAGSLILSGSLVWVAAWLGRESETGVKGAADEVSLMSLSELAVRGTTRRSSRSLATVGLLACGTFVIAALGVFRLDAGRDAGNRSSGTGGFSLIGEASLPILRDLNTDAGLEAYGLGHDDLPGVRFVPFRVRDGDDASCLNLNRAQRPRILGVRPELLADRGAFRFGQLVGASGITNGWLALRGANKANSSASESDAASDVIPAIGDSASIQWALGRKVGDVLELSDEAGRPFRVRLVGGLANSVLQGNLVIDEAAFLRLFPGEAGYRYFLMDAPTNAVDGVAATLSRAFEDVGLEVTPAWRRLAEFNAVQNTYLSTFQVLGGLGLILGSAGLGIVVLRNVLERRGELAVMTAVGYRRALLSRLILWEHGALLAVGLGVGLVAAVVAVLPSILTSAGELPWRSLAATVGGVCVLGLATAWVATQISLRRPLLESLRGE